MDNSDAQKRLAAVVRRLAVEKRGELDKHKANYVDLERPDFVWHYLLQSFATMGRSSGWHGLIGNRSNYNRVTYEAITALSEVDRLAELKTVCWAAKVRMPDRHGVILLDYYSASERSSKPSSASMLTGLAT